MMAHLYLCLVLLTLNIYGTTSAPARTARKARPSRAPLSSSLLQSNDPPTLYTASSTHDQPHHQAFLAPQQLFTEDHVLISHKTPSPSSHSNDELSSSAIATTFLQLPHWIGKRRRGGADDRSKYKEEGAGTHDDQLEKDATVLQSKTQHRMKTAIQEDESPDSDEKSWSLGLTVSTGPSSSTDQGTSPLGTEKANGFGAFSIGHNNQASSSSRSVTPTGREGRSIWSGAHYSTSSKRLRKKIFRKALKDNNLSVHTNTPAEFLKGILNLKVDKDGIVTKQSKALLAKYHIEDNAPSEAYKKAYFKHIDDFRRERDKLRTRKARLNQRNSEAHRQRTR